MINKRTVFVLGGGASCPYGYPSGARLREWICLPAGFRDHYADYLRSIKEYGGEKHNLPINEFVNKFTKSSRQSIDLFMDTNPKLAPTAKYIITFVIFEAEKRSKFRDEAKVVQEWYSRSRPEPRPKDFVEKGYFQGEDWYFYLFNRLTADVLPDFSDDKISFITFNYDRSLEHFLYESLINSFTEIPETEISKCLKKLKILHVYGQIVPLKWQDSEQGVDYRPQINESLLQKAASNIKTIYEQKESPELIDARKLIEEAKQIFFLGFGYAEENLEILKLTERKKRTSWIYGTAFGLEDGESNDCRNKIIEWLPVDSSERVRVEKMDCLKLLRNYF